MVQPDPSRLTRAAERDADRSGGVRESSAPDRVHQRFSRRTVELRHPPVAGLAGIDPSENAGRIEILGRKNAIRAGG